jgi:uncharacterized protein (DUF58 family)
MFRFLRPEDVRRLASYEFAPKTLVEGYLSGRHRSASRGTSTEFRDYRQYVAGDDPRQVDWKVFARSDRHYLRTFVQETNLDCHIFLDSSASMGFGQTITKLEYGSFFAAALCYLVTRNSDRVSLQIFDEKVRQFLPPGSTRRHLQNLMHVLEANQPGQKTSLSAALKRAFPLLRQRGTVVVISDFFDDSAAIFAALSPYLHRGFKVYLFHVLDPAEHDLPDRGLLAFEDLETGQRMVAHTDEVKKAYQRALEEHIRRLRELAARRQVRYCLARTDMSFFTLLDEMMG